jgi:hypothetical protein
MDLIGKEDFMVGVWMVKVNYLEIMEIRKGIKNIIFILVFNYLFVF